MFLIELCEALQTKRIKYAIVGGFAVALHGAVRGTVDVDLILEMSEKSFVAAEQAFLALNLVSRLPVKGSEVFKYRKEWIQNRNLIAWSFYDPQNPIRQLDVIITQDLAKKKTKTFKLKGISVSVLSVNDLIKMKKQSGRPQDLEDIKALKEIHG